MGVQLESKTLVEQMVIMTCGECGVPFGITSSHHKALKHDNCGGKGWYCPNGHNYIFTETEVQKQEKELEKKNRELASQLRDKEWELNHVKNRNSSLIREVNSERGKRGALTKKMKRVHNGVCPCCNRFFKNLQRHMASKHPNEVKSEE